MRSRRTATNRGDTVPLARRRSTWNGVGSRRGRGRKKQPKKRYGKKKSPTESIANHVSTKEGRTDGISAIIFCWKESGEDAQRGQAASKRKQNQRLTTQISSACARCAERGSREASTADSATRAERSGGVRQGGT